MKSYFKRIQLILMTALLFVLSSPVLVLAEEEEAYVPRMHATFWALIPPVVAICLALITKEVYSSLFVGIVVGALFYSDFSFEGTIRQITENGLIASVADSYNVGILIFLVMLGAIVALMNKSGGSAAFGVWAGKHIKTRVGAELCTILLGTLIFIDDYFNCLTVGSVMRPVTDRHNVSRAKLAYLIDATAAPVCIIAPVSSWAAAVASYVDGRDDGMALFIKAIPYNYYAILTIIMMVAMVLLKVEFGAMGVHESNALKGDLFTTGNRPYMTENDEKENKNGSVSDLLIPIISLVICSVLGMIYTGGFFSGESFVGAFSNCDASLGLTIGSLIGLLLTIILYLLRRVLTFKECMECIPEGFKAMVPAIMILILAWTLNSTTKALGAAEFVAGGMEAAAGSFMNFLPAIIFLVGCFLSFATGTSWGTFGILIPIVVAVFSGSDENLMIISISACMAGAVCGDHCSPISDTTIMASAGAQCEHVNHVSTQLPYAVVAAAVSFVSFLVAGFVKNPVISLAVAVCIMLAMLFLIKKYFSDLKEN